MKNVKYCGGLVLPPKGVHRIICVAEKTSRVSSVSGKDSKNKKIFSKKLVVMINQQFAGNCVYLIWKMNYMQRTAIQSR